MRILFMIPMLLQALALPCQDTKSTKEIAAMVELDSVVIVATRQGFSVEDFIHLVRTDTSLYAAFHNLRTISYVFETEMSFIDRKERAKATYHSLNIQRYHNDCRSMEVLKEEISGDFFKERKQQHRYYTYALYDRLFITHGMICTKDEASEQARNEKGTENGMERHVQELKNLIFRPGTRSNVPLIGKKTEIFAEHMIDLYQFAIHSDEYQDHPVYVFSARVKDEFREQENKTVFKELTSYFHKEDFQVIARSYRLSQHSGLYMFDVTMHVDLFRIGEKYFPTRITYRGAWDIPTKKKEAGTFSINFSDFQ